MPYAYVTLLAPVLQVLGGKFFYVQYMGTHVSVRGKGLGSKVLERLCRDADEQGVFGGGVVRWGPSVGALVQDALHRGHINAAI